VIELIELAAAAEESCGHWSVGRPAAGAHRDLTTLTELTLIWRPAGQAQIVGRPNFGHLKLTR
jgi:hypothetical protein